jgi:hypothetical protein
MANFQLDDMVSINRGGTPGVANSGTYYVGNVRDLLNQHAPILQELGGNFLLDPNEFNGWSTNGPTGDRFQNDLGDVGAAPIRTAGGFCFPFDVKLTRLYAWHMNSNVAVQAWGFRVFYQTKVDGSNAVTNQDLINQVAGNGGVGPNNYGNTDNQLTDIDTSGSAITIPAGSIVGFGVEAPTAPGTNYFVRIMGGYMRFERA